MKTVIALAATLCACATSGDPAPAAGVSGDDLDRLLRREGPVMESHEVSAPDGFFRARVEGASAPTVEKQDHGYYLAWQIGGGAPIECTVFSEGKDLAASTAGISEVFFREAAAAFGEVEARAVAAVDVGTFGPSPYVRVDWAYRTRRDGGKLAGLFKIVFADAAETTAQCMHNEVGYRETFTRVSRGLIDSLETNRKPRGEIFYTDIFLARVDGQPIGVMRRTFSHDRDGDVAIEIKGATLFAAEGKITATLDMFGHEVATPAGELLGSVRAAVENGELSTDLKLQRAATGGWLATGVHRGTEINEMFESAEPLSGELAQILALRRALAAGENELELTHYSPSRALGAATALAFRITGRAGDIVLGTMAEGGEVTRVQIDPDGLITRQESSLGDTALVFERVYQDGRI